MEYVDLQPKKPENIALSFSGGGFRAASYALGCLAYLESIQIGGEKMTSLVNFISSVSGGSFTNLAYTAGQRNGQTFEEFYTKMSGWILNGTLLLDRVYEILEDDSCWEKRPEKSKNIINAFSIAYDEFIFNGRANTFGIYTPAQKNVVKEVCINTTEFDNGMLFRFQNAGFAGNRFLRFKSDFASKATLDKIKLSDILACSSCFTVGFEPFMFPADFTHADLSQTSLQEAIVQDPRFSPDKDESRVDKDVTFGLMDGGIDDNQGIDSFIRAEDRLQNKNKFGYDLYISCDVSSNYTTGYDFPKENKTSWLLRPGLLQYLFAILFLTGISITGIVTKTIPNVAFTFLGIGCFLLTLAVFLFYKGFVAYRQSVRKKNTYGLSILPHVMLFLRFKLSTLLQIINSRVSSAGYLAAVVFLKKIRRISYDRLFEKISERKLKANGAELKDGEDESLATKVEVKHWRNFSLQNAVYLLSPKNDLQRIADLKKEDWYDKNPTVLINDQPMKLIDLMTPSPELQNVALLATEMDTTLWYDQNHINEGRPQALIAAGKFTTCYNLIRYAFRFDSIDPYWAAFQNQLALDWYNFNHSPTK